ncbi:MAG: hypothetical protein QOC69_425 [Mycobacterium sp.]|jgi:hypothetical protein|nr:hypothetical protein [Mycobacterium sp.]
MYLSAERLALANQTVWETFQRTSVACQAIPHWETGDPAQSSVRSDSVPPSAPLPIEHVSIPFQVTLAEAIAPTPDALLGKVMQATTWLALIVDIGVMWRIRDKVVTTQDYYPWPLTSDEILATLIRARAAVEVAGYRAPSCIFVDTESLIDLSKLVSGYAGTDVLLGPAMINALHRVESLKRNQLPPLPPPPPPANLTRLILLGRRERIAQGAAWDASPGEEPVDLAVSVMPSLEVIGDTPTNTIELNVRVSGAVRVKDPSGLVALVST